MCVRVCVHDRCVCVGGGIISLFLDSQNPLMFQTASGPVKYPLIHSLNIYIQLAERLLRTRQTLTLHGVRA